jgi:hypothetical protein
MICFSYLQKFVSCWWFHGHSLNLKNDRICIMISLIAAIWLRLITVFNSNQIPFILTIIHLILRRLVWNRLFALRTYMSEMVLISITKWHKHTDGADKMSTNYAWDFFRIFIKTTTKNKFHNTIIIVCDLIETK